MSETTIWSPGFIGGVCLKNRIIRSAVNDAQGDAFGRCTPAQVSLCREQAKGGVGAIISGHLYVHRSGMAGNRQLGIDQDSHMEGLSQLVEAAHEAGCVIFAQLSHAGSQADIYLTGGPPTGPSSLLSPEGPMSWGMSVDDIHTVVKAFAAAASRAKRCGFDGVQLHAAHGYCLSEFLSPAFNKRTDSYGGNARNRGRMLLEACREVRAEVGPDYPVLIKVNGEDFRENGMTRAMMRESVAPLVEEALIDAVEISGLWGKSAPRTRPLDASRPGSAAYAYASAVEFRAAFDIPLILVGGINSPQMAHALVNRGDVDFVAMARPLLKDPALVRRWWRQEQKRLGYAQEEDYAFWG